MGRANLRVQKQWPERKDLVLDCCMGTGSVGEAAVNAGRRFCGMELDEEWFFVEKERIPGCA